MAMEQNLGQGYEVFSLAQWGTVSVYVLGTGRKCYFGHGESTRCEKEPFQLIREL